MWNVRVGWKTWFKKRKREVGIEVKGKSGACNYNENQHKKEAMPLLVCEAKVWDVIHVHFSRCQKANLVLTNSSHPGRTGSTALDYINLVGHPLKILIHVFQHIHFPIRHRERSIQSLLKEHNMDLKGPMHSENRLEGGETWSSQQQFQKIILPYYEKCGSLSVFKVIRKTDAGATCV